MPLTYTADAGPSSAIAPRPDVSTRPEKWVKTPRSLLYKRTELTKVEVLCIQALIDHDWFGTGCYPSNATLMVPCRLKDPGSVSRVLSGLRRKRCIRIELFPPSPSNPTGRKIYLTLGATDATGDGPRLHGETVQNDSAALSRGRAPRFRGGERRAFAGESAALSPTEVDSPEDELRRRQTDSSRVAGGDEERSSSSSSMVSGEEGEARTPDDPVPRQDDDQGDPARLALIARVQEIAPGEARQGERQAILDAIPAMLKTAKLARSPSPSPFDHVRMAIEKAASSPKRRDTIEGLARGILRNWVDEGFPAIVAAEPPGKPKPPPDTEAEARASAERRRAELAAEAGRAAELAEKEARFEALTGPQREQVVARARAMAPGSRLSKLLCYAAMDETPPAEVVAELEPDRPSPPPAPIRAVEVGPPPVAAEPPSGSLAPAVDRAWSRIQGSSGPTPPPAAARADAAEVARRYLAQLDARKPAARVEPPRPVEAGPPTARPSVLRRVIAVASFGIL